MIVGRRAVPQQAQRDVHADLGAAAGEQRTLAGQVGAGVALGVVEPRAGRAELVVERVDLDVGLLADVARPGLEQRPRGGALRAGDERDALGLVVDAARAAGGRRVDDRAVGGADGVPLLGAALLLGGLEQRRRRTAGEGEVRVVGREPADLVRDPQEHVQVGGVDAVDGRRGRWSGQSSCGSSLVVSWSSEEWPTGREHESRGARGNGRSYLARTGDLWVLRPGQRRPPGPDRAVSPRIGTDGARRRYVRSAGARRRRQSAELRTDELEEHR